MSYFIPPPANLFSELQSNYYSEWLDELQKNYPSKQVKRPRANEKKSYTEYNYSLSGISSKIKTAHFEKVLQLTAKASLRPKDEQ